jgi:uncharacterized protein YnzC (UPF0291/DUF896 family)
MARRKKTTPLTPEEQERQAILDRSYARRTRELEDMAIRNQLEYEAREAERQQKAS